MNGLVVWAQSYCRSTLAFYEGLAQVFNVPLRVLVWLRDTSLRTGVGHSDDEFGHLDTCFIDEDIQIARKELSEHKDWHHLFGTYQKGSLFRKMLLEARDSGCSVAIISEAPCNMFSPPMSMLKEIYISKLLGCTVAKQIKAADFIVNLSGDEAKNLVKIGWSSDKIINCGYYSPPLFKSRFRLRGQTEWQNFTILLTGLHEWHRNPMVLLQALFLLKQRGVYCNTIITQEGPLLCRMKRFAEKHGLNIDFAGFVAYERLLELYQTCSCYVASGRAEPWGMRVNDALHCGAPLIVSEGMGAVKLVNEYNCGLSFANNNATDLADKLQSLIEQKDRYLQIAQGVCVASDGCMPHHKAKVVAGEIQSRFPSWA